MIKYKKEPLKIKHNAPNGNYRVSLSITAKSDTIYTIYSQDRRFVAADIKIKEGETHTRTFIVNVCDYIRREAAHRAEGIEILIACDDTISAEYSVSPVDVPTLYIIGDSTVTDQPAYYPYEPEKTYCGWGQVIPMLLDNGIAVQITPNRVPHPRKQ